MRPAPSFTYGNAKPEDVAGMQTHLVGIVGQLDPTGPVERVTEIVVTLRVRPETSCWIA